ncbi:hypothetical protein DPMN_045983 [Dreissena polymorpha]|uniref:Uncharacterized protein n=1 Tax=Dreissena polymorpha TaxID=45954 RepID=A0A9D4I1V4_DREPO|nr:hypothetical protein DPMN_045983 [Dreissena polymorpha]
MYDQSDKLARSFTSPTTDLTRQCLSDVPKCRTLMWCPPNDLEVTGLIPSVGAFLRNLQETPKYWF